MARLLPLLVGLTLVGCVGQKGPIPPYDTRHSIHFLVHADPPPKPALKMRPECRVGDQIRKTPMLRLPDEGFSAVEVAIIGAVGGKHTLGIADPLTGAVGVKEKVEVNRDLWVVLEISSKTRVGRLRIYERPPNDQVGRWRPLVRLPD